MITACSQHQNTWQQEGHRSHLCSQQAAAGATSNSSKLQPGFSKKASHAAQCETAALKSTSAFCHLRANEIAQFLLHPTGRGRHPWSELGLVFRRMSHSAEWGEGFSSFLRVQQPFTTGINGAVLPFSREQLWVG